MSESLAPGLQKAYELATQFHMKDTDCPTCGKKIKSVIIKSNKILFKPCGCIFAVVEVVDDIDPERE